MLDAETLNLNRLGIFVAVVDAGSFTAAGKRLAMSKSAVSKQVKQLEQELGVRLLNRNTRSVGLTRVGEAFYERCAHIIAEVQSAAQHARQAQETPRGTLRVASTVSFGTAVLAPALPGFLQTYPDLQVELLLENKMVDLVKEGMDVALRLGYMPDSTLVCRRLTSFRHTLCAAPSYLARCAAPQTPADLANHEWNLLTIVPGYDRWVFHKDGESFPVRATGSFRTNSPSAMIASVFHGVGIAPLLDYICKPAIARGELVPLLEGYTLDTEIGLYAVYPHQRFRPRKVQLFLEHLQKHLPAKTNRS